jgi:beta-lactamase regulating signal transducer with metallopeptidase domain
VLAVMVGVSALPQAATAPVYEVVMTSKTLATAGRVVGDASARALSGLDSVETAATLLVLGALAGLAVAGVRQVIGRARLKKIVAKARPVSQELALAVRAAARRMDTGRPEVKVSDDIDQPMLAGLTIPVILLPADLVARLDVQRLVPICAHELAHLKRGDNWRLLFEHLLGGLFWMVPPYALLRARAAATREELADTLALDGASQVERRGYAETLIDVLRTRAAPALQPAFTGKGRKPTLMRLQAITTPRDPASFTRKVLLGLAGLLAIALAAGGSIALAQQGDGAGRNSSRTTISDTKTGQFIDIRSDYVRVTNAELAKGKLTVPTGQMSSYHGHVQVLGRLKAPETLVLLNGKPAPEGFDPTTLAEGAIDQIEVTNYENRKPSVVLNVMMKPSV